MGAVSSWVAQCMYPEEQLFWQAARTGDPTRLRTLLANATPEQRVHIDWKEPLTGRTALAEASAGGNHACAMALVEAGANCSAKDHAGDTPLHLAAKHGKDATVKYLLQLAQVSAFELDRQGMTPLDLARATYLKNRDQHYPHFHGLEHCIQELESVWMTIDMNVFSSGSGG